MAEDQIATWLQVAAVVVAIAAVGAAVLAAIATSVLAIVLGALDRRNVSRVAARDHEFQQLFREQDLLHRLLENYNRGGSSDATESSRMGSDALTLIGAIGPRRLPELWNSHVNSDTSLRESLEDPEMPDYKKEAIKVQLAVNANRAALRDLAEAADN